MVNKLVTFEGTPGQPVLVGQNSIYEINIGEAYYTADHKFGSSSVVVGNPTDTANNRFRVDIDVSGDHYGSIYLKNATAQGSGTSHVAFLMVVASNGGWVAEFRASPSNAMSIRSNSVDIRSGSLNEIPIDQWFRLEWRVAGTGGATPTFYWRLFQNADATTPDISGSYTITGITAPVETLMLGGYSNNLTIPKHWTFDQLRVSDTATDWLGPYSDPVSPTSGVTVWDGAQEVAVSSITVWNGTTEVPASFSTVV